MIRSALVVGAGLAGLVAAQRLAAAGIRVTVFDKGRGPGGRMATRREGDACWDHGAQFFTARDPRFAEMVARWTREGVATRWDRAAGPTVVDRLPRARGVPTMSALGRYLSRGLDVRLASPIEAVLCGDDEGIDRPGCDGPWRARPALQGVAGAVEGAAEFAAQAMVLTAPVPQSLALLDAGGVVLADTDRAMLERIAYDPCLALLATLDGPSRLPPPGALEPAAGPLGWIADNHAKGVSPVPTATIHATAAWSTENWERDRNTVAGELLRAALPLLGVGVKEWRVHAWRYARPTVLHDTPCLLVRAPRRLVFAGDAFVASRVEGAALSGLAAADALLQENAP